MAQQFLIIFTCSALRRIRRISKSSNHQLTLRATASVSVKVFIASGAGSGKKNGLLSLWLLEFHV